MTTEAAVRADMRTWAAVAASRRWHVFPVRPGDKRPACDRWEQRACADPELVRRHWPGLRHNVGIACGPSGLVVIDLDPPDGIEMFGLLCRNHQYRPQTYTVRTPRAGLHLYYLAPAGREIRNSASRVAEHVDIRGRGGYVVGAGSIVGGRPYEVTDGREPAQLPGWLADLADPPAPPRAEGTAWRPRASSAGSYGATALQGETDILLGTRRGGRNDQLNRSAFALGQLVGAGELGEDEVTGALLATAEAIGLVAEDGTAACLRTIRSGLTAGITQPRYRVVA